MRTEISERLGIDRAIFGFSHSREVVAAVSAAGGLGVLGTVRRTPEALDEDLRWITQNNDGRPFGVDIVYPASSAGDSRRELAAQLPPEHIAFVNSLAERFNIPAPSDPDRVDLYSGHALTMSAARALTEVTFAYDVPLIVSALGVPPEDLIERIHRRGTLLGALVGSPRHAVRQVAAGVDVIVAQGSEAGGHVGQLSTMVLTPQVVDAVPGTPVLAAGGIADGRQIAAAQMLGAQGVWLGSIWLTTVESISPDSLKQRLLEATSEDTLVTKAYSGKTVRLLRTPWIDAWNEPGAPAPLKAPLQGVLIHESMTSIVENNLPGLVGSPVGQVVGFMNEEESTSRVMERLVAQYEATKARV